MRLLTARLRREMAGPADQHPPCPAAVVQGPRHASARARSRRARAWLHGAFRDRRNRRRADHRAGRRAGAGRRQRGRLAARVLKAEHQLYPLALRLVAEGKAMDGQRHARCSPAWRRRPRRATRAAASRRRSLRGDDRPRGAGALHALNAILRPATKLPHPPSACPAVRSRSEPHQLETCQRCTVPPANVASKIADASTA